MLKYVLFGLLVASMPLTAPPLPSAFLYTPAVTEAMLYPVEETVPPTIQVSPMFIVVFAIVGATVKLTEGEGGAGTDPATLRTEQMNSHSFFPFSHVVFKLMLELKYP